MTLALNSYVSSSSKSDFLVSWASLPHNFGFGPLETLVFILGEFSFTDL
jgi:hypothetical protein